MPERKIITLPQPTGAICPLLTTPILVNYGEVQLAFVSCIKEGCLFWSDKDCRLVDKSNLVDPDSSGDQPEAARLSPADASGTG